MTKDEMIQPKQTWYTKHQDKEVGNTSSPNQTPKNNSSLASSKALAKFGETPSNPHLYDESKGLSTKDDKVVEAFL